MNTRGRLIVAAIAVVALAYALAQQQFYLCIYIMAILCYLLWSHFREGTVYLATQAFHKQDYERTKELLSEVKNPDRLRKGRRNFYEFMMGNIALKEGRVDEAEYHFQLASRLPWRRDMEKGMVLINLANINLRKQAYDRVRAYIEVAEKLKLTARQRGIIDMLKTEISKSK